MNRWFVLALVIILLVSSAAAAVFLLNPTSRDEYSRYPHYPFYVSISADGNYILARYRAPDGFVQLFGNEDNIPLWAVALYPISWIESSSISADGNFICVAARDVLYLLSKDNNEPLWTFYPTNALKTVLISADSNYLVAADYDKLHFFARVDNIPLWSYDGYYQYVSISTDGSSLAVGGEDHIYLFGKDNNIPLWSYPSEMSVSISADGNYIAASGGYSIYLFTKENNAPIWSYSFENEKWARKIAISADGNYIAAIASEYIYHPDRPGDLREYLYVFSIENTEPLWSSTLDVIIEAGTAPMTLLAISSDGSHIAAGTHRKLHLFGRADNIPLWSYEFSEREDAYSVSMSADGNYIAVGTEGGPSANIGGSVYLFNRDGNIVWSYHHEVEPYPIG